MPHFEKANLLQSLIPSIADPAWCCSFEMEAIEAHATVSPPVAFRSLGGGVLSRRTLRDSAAGALAVAPANPQVRSPAWLCSKPLSDRCLLTFRLLFK